MQFLYTNWVAFYNFRIKEFDDSLNEDHLDVLQIRKLCFAGKIVNNFFILRIVVSPLKKSTQILYLNLLIQVFQKGKGDERWLGEYCSITCQRVGKVGRTTLKNKEIYIINFLVSFLVSNGSNRLLCLFQYPKNDIWQIILSF